MEPRLFLKRFHTFSSNSVNIMTAKCFTELLIPAIYNSSINSLLKHYMAEFLEIYLKILNPGVSGEGNSDFGMRADREWPWRTGFDNKSPYVIKQAQLYETDLMNEVIFT